MALVTDTQVQALVPMITNASLLDQFITTADLIITEELSNRGLTTARLTQIELYLAAHFALIVYERGGLQSQRIGFQGPEDVYKPIDNSETGFMTTRFGQQAVALDSSGRLGAMSKNPIRARFKVAASPKCWSDSCTTNDNTGFNSEDAE